MTEGAERYNNLGSQRGKFLPHCLTIITDIRLNHYVSVLTLMRQTTRL